MEKQVKAFHDELAARRAHHSLYDKRKVWGRLKAEETDWLNHEIESLAGNIVLDAGCGPGPHIGLALEKGASQVIAMDFSQKMLILVAERYHDKRVERLCCDLRHTPLRDGVVDYVICLDTLHHLKGENRRTAILNLLNSAKGGATILIDIKNRNNPVLLWRYRKRGNFYLPTEASTEREIKQIVSSLSIIEKEKGIGFPLKIISPYIIFKLRRL
jgi:SAM-dependent methyltransferase